ncbi:MAG TPA: DUF1127 domain-containing protein [Xanthobacteraceae bacterium]|jgi:uncharacterized protein YjiS (DUF1127 family)
MSTMMPNALRALAHLGQGFTVWWERANSRNELRNFGDRELRDIGLSREEASREATKPFWMA